jgi:hypothetical protein
MGRPLRTSVTKPRGDLRTARDPLEFWGPLSVLLLLGALAVASPWGVLAWGEYDVLLDQRLAEKRALEADLAALQNRVRLLDPEAADDDLVGELVRRNLGVLHSDEVIVIIEEE